MEKHAIGLYKNHSQHYVCVRLVFSGEACDRPTSIIQESLHREAIGIRDVITLLSFEKNLSPDHLKIELEI